MHYQQVLRRQDAEDTDAERVAPGMTTPTPPTGVSQTTGGATGGATPTGTDTGVQSSLSVQPQKNCIAFLDMKCPTGQLLQRSRQQLAAPAKEYRSSKSMEFGLADKRLTRG